ncbi:lipase member I-like [Anticarsia gemmatalis]|uniref:lipase member I-like n=1 Tax=Anticarsia gemmatalis TaxID=129554 RepID=UPI003F75A46D
MISTQHIEILHFFSLLLLVGLYAASLPHPSPAKFSVNSLFDATMSMIHPVVAAGSNRCEAFKSFFGLTYEQMQEKNKTNFHEVLNIDLITEDGNVKYNLTANKRINRLMANAKTIVILIHGFMESSDGWMVHGLAPVLLKKSDLKIFALDGRKIINLEYFRSSTYVRFMGELLGSFLGDLVKNGQDPSKIYIVGHSLGSHIAGVAGKKVHELTGQLLGRITALDPAGPCFSNVSASGRLDRTDAEYVDVIHSNAGMLGIKEPVGHKDFYPNGGSSQPGCYISFCDHSRAWEYFAESINSPKHFPARKCDNWTMFGQGACSKNDISYMGIESQGGGPGFYFLTTKNSAPYGMGSAGSG